MCTRTTQGRHPGQQPPQPRFRDTLGLHSPCRLGGSLSCHPASCQPKCEAALWGILTGTSLPCAQVGGRSSPGVRGLEPLGVRGLAPGTPPTAWALRLLVVNPQALAGNGAHASQIPGSPLEPRLLPAPWEFWAPCRSVGADAEAGRRVTHSQWGVGAEPPTAEGGPQVRHSFALFFPPLCPRP